MEFFEKAHVLKRSRSIKDKKAEENKKRLKQMLYGYKHNDNVTIKESANRQVDLEDTNTYSEDDIDITLAGTSNFETKENAVNSDVADDSSIVIQGKKTKRTEFGTLNDSQSITRSSDDELASIESNTFSFENSTSTEQDSETETFDANGVLASQILKKLSKIEKTYVKSIKNKKGKREKKDTIENNFVVGTEMGSMSVKEKIIKKKKVETKTKKKKDENKPKSEKDVTKTKKKEDETITNKIKRDKSVKGVSQHSSNNDEPACSSSGQVVQAEVVNQKPKQQIEKQQIPHNIDIDDNFMYSDSDENSLHSIETYDEMCENSSTQSSFSSVVTYKAEDSMMYQGFNDILSAYKYPTITTNPLTKPITSETTKIFSSSYDCDDDDYTNVFNESKILVNLDNLAFPDNALDDTDQQRILHFSPEPQLPDEELDQLLDLEHNDDSSVQMIQGELAVEKSIDYSKQCRVLLCNDSCVLVMQHPAELYIHGKVTVIPLAGKAEVFGHVLNDACNIFAPYIYYPQCLKTLERESSYYGLFGKMTSLGLSVYDVEDVVSKLGQYDVVIQLKRLESHKLDFVDNYFNVTDLFKRGNKSSDDKLIKISEFLGCSLTLKNPMRSFKECLDWNLPFLHGYNKVGQSRCVVSGGKGLGKSTFVRYYVNRMVKPDTPVLVVDLDPGQCEFTVAGNISATVVTKPLLGPSFTHMKYPDRMLNVGMINVMDNLRRYANAVTSLITYCSTNEQYKNIPWIINTMGMCNTVGLKLMSLILLHLKPTYMLQFQSYNPKKRFECKLDANTIIHKYFTEFKDDELFRDVSYPERLDYGFGESEPLKIDSTGLGKGNYCLAARDERYLNFLAYFGELLDIHKGPGFLSITPYEVPLLYLKIGANIKLDAEIIDKVINGKIIALCEREQDSAGKMFTLNDKPLLCHGHGLIRGIDCKKGLLYIVTPTPVALLSLVDTLVYADWVPELRGQEKHLPDRTAVPFRMPTLPQRQLTHVPRRRFNPLQFLKMSRNS